MESFPLNTGAYYLKRYSVWRVKTGEAEKSIEILQQHMPLLYQKLFRERQQLNILSVGSAEGEKGMMFLKNYQGRATNERPWPTYEDFQPSHRT